MALLRIILRVLYLILLGKVLFVNSKDKIKLFPKYYAKTTAINCFGNPKQITNLTCKLKAINWKHTVANMDVVLLNGIRNATGRLELFKYTNQFRPFFLNITVNGCDVLQKQQTSLYIKAVLNIISKYSNINHTCPFTGHLTANGIYIDTELFPFGMPYGKYKFVFTLFEGWPLDYVATCELTIDVVEGNVDTSGYKDRGI